MNVANLNGALLVRTFSSVEGDERVYAWFGGIMIHVYDFELYEIDVFTNYDLTKPFTEHDALMERAWTLIDEHEDARFSNENCTDDIFYSHEWDTGEDLETQKG